MIAFLFALTFVQSAYADSQEYHRSDLAAVEQRALTEAFLLFLADTEFDHSTGAVIDPLTMEDIKVEQQAVREALYNRDDESNIYEKEVAPSIHGGQIYD